jgi:uncharacterized protein (DUF433 family)
LGVSFIPRSLAYTLACSAIELLSFLEARLAGQSWMRFTHLAFMLEGCQPRGVPFKGDVAARIFKLYHCPKILCPPFVPDSLEGMEYNQARMSRNDYIEQRDGGFYIKETRVPLDSIVQEFRGGASPETIRQVFPTLTLEQVYGAIAFYLGHQEEVDASLRDAEQAWSEFEATHPVPESIQERLREARGGMTSRREQ